jgi:hypothetical protein
MFADLVDIGFEEILKFTKESMTYYPEMEDDEYADLYIKMTNIPFIDYKKKTYFHRNSYPDNVFLRADISTEDFNDVPDSIQNLPAKDIMEKIENGEYRLILKLLYCNIEDDKIIEDHEIAVNHVVNGDDLFAEDWSVYTFD